VSIPDNYVGADAHGYGDRIGDSRYEVQGMDVTVDATFMNVRVFTNFNQATVRDYLMRTQTAAATRIEPL